MSWDVVVFNLNKKVSSVEEINEDILIPIATCRHFKKILHEHFPDVKWDGDRGIVERENVYMELFIDESEETFSNTVFFLREGEASIFDVINFCKRHGWQLYDTALGEMIDLDNPARNGYANYAAYIKHITGNIE